MEIICSAQNHIVIGRRNNWLVHVEWWQLVRCKCNILCPTSEVKSVYGKSQSVKGSKLFSSYRTVFKLIAQSKVFMIPQSISDLNWSWFIPHKMVKNFWGLGMTHLRIWQKFAQLMHKIIRKISAEYYVRIRRNCSSNVRLETPKLGVQSKFIWF